MFQHFCGCTCAQYHIHIYCLIWNVFTKSDGKKLWSREVREQLSSLFYSNGWCTSQFAFSSSCPLRHTRTNTLAARFPFRKHDWQFLEKLILHTESWHLYCKTEMFAGWIIENKPASSPQKNGARCDSHLFLKVRWQLRALSTPACAWSPPAHRAPSPRCHPLRTPALGTRGLERMCGTFIGKQGKGEKKHYNVIQEKQSLSIRYLG